MSQETRVVDYDKFKPIFNNLIYSRYFNYNISSNAWSPSQISDLQNMMANIQEHIRNILLDIDMAMEQSLYSVERCLLCSKKYKDEYHIPDSLKPE